MQKAFVNHFQHSVVGCQLDMLNATQQMLGRTNVRIAQRGGMSCWCGVGVGCDDLCSSKGERKTSERRAEDEWKKSLAEEVAKKIKKMMRKVSSFSLIFHVVIETSSRNANSANQSMRWWNTMC